MEDRRGVPGICLIPVSTPEFPNGRAAMEFHTNRARTEQDMEVTPAPEQNKYLRRKTTQKLRKSHFVSRRILSALRIVASLGAFVLVSAFLLSLFVYAYNSDKFALRNVTIHGCRQSDPRKLEAVVREASRTNLLRLDLRRIRSLVEDQAWVKRAEVRRVLPSDLVVHIEERVPSVILEMQGDLMVTDDDGVLLDRYDPRYGKLDVPVFKGALGDDPAGYRSNQKENAGRIRMGLKFLSDLDAGSPDYARSISEIDISDKSNIKVTLVDDTAEIYFGDRDFLKRFNTLKSNLTQYEELKSQYPEITVVDLRFDGNIIYRPGRSAGGQPDTVSGSRP